MKQIMNWAIALSALAVKAVLAALFAAVLMWTLVHALNRLGGA